ncbi:class I SAM-dependent methyltransferase [uncultured Erythrobacter sp.]|uniref:class I SAM-dependent methyltransferase n=1 Tax=uncultured Erythrobacter sp. TaxID=263913 RepID=UPI00261B8611|nr:class I SAM-dependent methyltransferase [uncultured Erythrobacter sp.]
MSRVLQAKTVEGRQFDNFVDEYAKARPVYPRQVFDRMVLLHGKRFFRAVDIGCGTGQSLEGLDNISAELIGIDPSSVMLEEARKRVPGATFVRASGEDTTIESSSVDLVSIATAFHWMDPAGVVREAHRILTGGGLLAVYRYDIPELDGDIGGAFDRRLQADWRPFISEKILFPGDPFDLLVRSEGWAFVSRTVIPYAPRYSSRQFVDLMLATSYVREFLAEHPDPGRYEREFYDEFHRLAPDGVTPNLDIKLTLGTRNG